MNSQELAAAALELLLRQYRLTMRNSEKFSLVLCGGRGPQSLYRLLAEKSVSNQINWQKVHVFWSDERCVSPGDARSNFKLAEDLFLKQVAIPKSNVHPIICGDSAAAAAKEYEIQLRNYFKNTPPHFDLMLLGLGEDGHTASIFPESSALSESTKWVVAAKKQAENISRITLTFPIINQARQILVLVSSSSKDSILKQALAPAGTTLLPAQLIQPKDGSLHWLVAE